jgi:protein-tyrosine phosphatase
MHSIIARCEMKCWLLCRKDRTGLLVMLALRLCGIPFDVILNDYMISAKSMAVWGSGGREGLVHYLQTQPVLSVQKEYMSEAVRHLVRTYRDVPYYLRDCGVEPDVLRAVRKNLMNDSEAEALQMPM